jgi:hypothetical protein
MEDVEGCQGVEIDEGMVEVLTHFKYFGGMMVNDGKLEVELAARQPRHVQGSGSLRSCGARGIYELRLKGLTFALLRRIEGRVVV